MKIQNILLILISLIGMVVCSCAGGFYDQKVDLGAGYFYMGEGPGANTINRSVRVDKMFKTERFIIYPSVQDFSFNASYILIKQIPDSMGYRYRMATETRTKASIFNYVDTIKNRELQGHIKSLFFENISDSTFYRTLNTQLTPMSIDEEGLYLGLVVDSILQNDPQYNNIFAGQIQYWIIDKKGKKTLGPFNSTNFNKKKVELKISKSLILEGDQD